MIQRIQTLYLMVATLLMALTLIFPVATFNVGGEELAIKAFGFATSSGTLPHLPIYMGILLAVATLLPFVVIFLYKRRILQLRLCGVELALLVGSIVFEAIYCYITYGAVEAMGEGAMTIGVVAFMPIVAIVLVALAMRAILRDELLVRSLDRIR